MKIGYRVEYKYSIPYTTDGRELANEWEKHARLLLGLETKLDRSSTASQTLVVIEDGVMEVDDKVE